MALLPTEYQQDQLMFESLTFLVQIIGNQTQSSIKTFCPHNPLVVVYHEDDTRTVTAIDSGIGFALTDLDNDAPPAVLGFLIRVGDAVELVGVELVTNSIKSVSMSAPMTALGTVTFKGAAGAAGAVTKNGTSLDPTGVTASGNIAFVASLTSLDIDEDNATTVNNEFSLRVTYKKRQPV
jgi:hypothetical protein